MAKPKQPKTNRPHYKWKYGRDEYELRDGAVFCSNPAAPVDEAMVYLLEELLRQVAAYQTQVLMGK